MHIRLSVIVLSLASQGLAESSLQRQIYDIAAAAHGNVSVACLLPGSTLNCDLNQHAHPPMQSVFKAPLALTTLYLIEQGKFKLDQPIRFRASDRILPETWSALQSKYPAAEIDVPMRELLRLAVSESDNAAADVLLRTIGGPSVVQEYLQSLGIRGFHLVDNEAELHRDGKAQYRNYFEPAGAVRLLRRLNDNPPLTREHAALFLDWMQNTPRGNTRLKGHLPAETIVMHKTGSSGTHDGLTNAWNDIGLIAMPDGRRLAIAVFITDSTADESTRDTVIAGIAKAAYDAALQSKPSQPLSRP